MSVLRVFLKSLSMVSIFCSFALSAYGQSLTFGVERGTGRIICTDDGDYTPDKDDPSYALSAAWDRRVFGDADIPCYAPLTDLDAGVWKQSEPFAGADSEGRTADFRIYVLHDTYSWKIGSTWQIEYNGDPIDPGKIFQAPNFMDRFCGSNAAFAFGASSYEGPRGPNERTAAARSATISNALKTARPNCDPGRIPIIFGINLGEHEQDPECTSTACSATQRRVIIISADDITTGVDLSEALSAGIKEQRVFKGLDVDKYSLFDVNSH